MTLDQHHTVENDQQLINLLEEGLNQLGISTSQIQFNQLMRYIGLVSHWNKTYNLTAIRDPREMIIQHLFDALSVLQCVARSADQIKHTTDRPLVCLDLGSGVGVPGVPLAIMMPHLSWILVDSNGKKARFLREVKRQLDLENIEVEATRVEKLQLEGPFLVVARALASCDQILQWVEPIITPNSQVLLLKSHQGREEIAGFKSDQYSYRIVPLEVPMLQAERMIIVFERYSTSANRV